MKNDYKSALDKITAGDSFRNELINNMSGAKKPRPKLPYIAAVAACLAAVIALTVFLAPMSRNDAVLSQPEHSFCLTAYAAEGETVVNRNTYVKIGGISGYFKRADSPDDTTKSSKLKNDEQSFLPCFELRLICEGKDIDTVTFSSEDSRLWINDYTAKYFVTDYRGRSEVCRNGRGETGRYYKSFTFDYDNQVKASPYGKMELAAKTMTYDESAELPKSVKSFFDWFFGYCRTLPDFNSDTRYILNKLSDVSKLTEIVRECDKTELYNDMLNDLLSDAGVSITVRFTDGTEQTQRLQFRPTMINGETDKETDPVLTGKLV